MIGVLALQGNFDSHIKILEKINLNHKLVKTVDDLSSLDGLIIPGGESTTITNLLRRNQSLIDGINQLSQHKPILGSCAGLILMSKDSNDSRVHNFGFLDITTSRNAYGRQVHSFEASIKVKNEYIEFINIKKSFTTNSISKLSDYYDDIFNLSDTLFKSIIKIYNKDTDISKKKYFQD